MREHRANEHPLSKYATEIAINATPWVILLLTALFAPRAHANQLELRDLYIESKKAVGTNRTTLLPNGEQKRGELNLGVDYGYRAWYNRLKVTSFYASQFRHVSLTVETGFRLGSFEVFADHYSGHALDAVYDEKYPNMNSIGVRIKLVTK